MVIKKITYKEQVYDYLKESIIKGDLQPGVTYSEQQFADLLEVSRTPVREALLQLKNEELIEIYNNKGFGIKAISLEEIQQILQARSAIEGYSVGYLTERVTSIEGQAILKELKRCLEKAEKLSTDLENHYAFMKADVEFHGIIISFTKNKYFIRLIEQMRTRMEQATVNSLTLKNRHIDALKEHQRIYSYIGTGNVQKAVKAYEEHMEITAKALKKTGLI